VSPHDVDTSRCAKSAVPLQSAPADAAYGGQVERADKRAQKVCLEFFMERTDESRRAATASPSSRASLNYCTSPAGRVPRPRTGHRASRDPRDLFL
jgi:hypothetical protein